MGPRRWGNPQNAPDIPGERPKPRSRRRSRAPAGRRVLAPGARPIDGLCSAVGRFHQPEALGPAGALACPDLVVRRAQHEVLNGAQRNTLNMPAPSSALMVSLSNHEGVALSHPNPGVIPATAGIQGQAYRSAKPTRESHLRGNAIPPRRHHPPSPSTLHAPPSPIPHPVPPSMPLASYRNVRYGCADKRLRVGDDAGKSRAGVRVNP